MSVSKKDLSIQISKKLELSKKDSLFLVKNFFSFLSKNYMRDINIHGFGTFINKTSPKRVGRNPKTKEEFIIKPRNKVSFRSSKEVRERIN